MLDRPEDGFDGLLSQAIGGRCRVGDAMHRPQHPQAGRGAKIDETSLNGATIVTQPRLARSHSGVRAKTLAATDCLGRSYYRVRLLAKNG